MNKYEAFLQTKVTFDLPTGFEVQDKDLNPKLFDFQKAIVKWALKRGRAATFCDCGLGKTPMQLEWARHVCEHTKGRVLILAPLAVAQQTVREGKKFGIHVEYARQSAESKASIVITNYEMLKNFSASDFIGVVLDESSAIKAYSGKFRNEVIEIFAKTPFKLACTATPAPNDFMELGNHAEFLGVMSRTEMLCTYFIHDGGETSKWRLKGHAEDPFWKWMCSWSVFIRKPSDLGYSDKNFELPPLKIHTHILESNNVSPDFLFEMPAVTLQEQRAVKRHSISERVNECAKLVNASKQSWVIWGELNQECDDLEDAINDASQITGSDTLEFKETTLLEFSSGKIAKLVSKCSISGYGLNWQHCSNMIFMNLSHSFEDFYQAIRRCWRFGQKETVNVHVFIMSTETAILENIRRKQKEADLMAESMVCHMRGTMQENIKGLKRERSEYKMEKMTTDKFEMRLGDCVETIKSIKSDSIHYSIFSPPFASLYTYSATERDMGNCPNHKTFYEHFDFLIKELYRVIMPGRLLSFHCMNLPTSKERDGIIGISDFRGNLIKAFVDAGWIYHSEVCIWKDPVTAMQRTKALGLLHKQIKKDSCMSRQGIPDYLVTMRKPGDNPERVTHTNESFPVKVWQQYASPVWMDINPSNTLQRFREENDERHICALQLEVIERALALWTNPNDIVLSPFAGIGSEGYVSIKKDRRFVGLELKENYYRQAVKNLQKASVELKALNLFEVAK